MIFTGGTMKALVKKDKTKGVWLEEVDMPDVGDYDVLIRIKKTSICGTDIHIYNWDQWAQKTIPVPLTIGHEFVGTVEKFGQNVKGVQVGDLVSGEGHVVCGKCYNCLSGKKHLCRKTEGVGVTRNGAFAEYLSIPITNVWHCDPSIPTDILSCFDPLGNAVHCARAFSVLGEDVLITGAGPIGIMAASVARHAGARNIVMTDINPYRLNLAKKLGSAHVVNISEENISDLFEKLKIKEGFDVGLEMSGTPAGFQDLITNMCHGGKIAVLGILPPDTAINWQTVVFNGLTIKGIYGRKMYETWFKMTHMLQSGLDISEIITHRFHFSEFQKGFDAMRKGRAGKVILTWS